MNYNKILKDKIEILEIQLKHFNELAAFFQCSETPDVGASTIDMFDVAYEQIDLLEEDVKRFKRYLKSNESNFKSTLTMYPRCCLGKRIV